MMSIKNMTVQRVYKVMSSCSLAVHRLGMVLYSKYREGQGVYLVMSSYIMAVMWIGLVMYSKDMVVWVGDV